MQLESINIQDQGGGGGEVGGGPAPCKAHLQFWGWGALAVGGKAVGAASGALVKARRARIDQHRPARPDHGFWSHWSLLVALVALVDWSKIN